MNVYKAVMGFEAHHRHWRPGDSITFKNTISAQTLVNRRGLPAHKTALVFLTFLVTIYVNKCSTFTLVCGPFFWSVFELHNGCRKTSELMISQCIQEEQDNLTGKMYDHFVTD